MPNALEPVAGAPLAVTQRLSPLRAGAGAVALLLVVAVAVVALAGGGSGQGSAGAPAAIVPEDALAYVNLAVGGGRPAARQALKIAARFPDFPLIGGAGLTRFATLIAGGRSVDYARQIRPWLGDDVALALLDTRTSTAATMLVLGVRDAGRARAFLHAEGAVAAGRYRATALERYPNGSEIALVDHFLVLGPDASVRAAIDTAARHGSSLASDAVFRRTSAGQPANPVLDGYASLAGIRELLTNQQGLIGALGSLLYQPALQAVSMAVTPTALGFALRMHEALDPTLEQINGSPTTPFTPTLASVLPAATSLMLDVTGLDHVAPRVLDAGASAGVASAIGPLLSRLGGALKSEGVNVAEIVSIFAHEAAVAIIPNGRSPTLVIAARTADPSRARTELAELEVPLAQLFAPAGQSASSAPVFNDKSVGGVTAHQLVLATGLQLDYAVFRGLVVISTGLPGIAAVASRGPTLATDPAFRTVIAQASRKVTSLVYANPAELLNLGSSTGLTGTSAFSVLESDLRRLTAVGLVSMRGPSDSTSEITVQVPAR